MTFQIEALPYEPFANLFEMSDAELVARGARRAVADADVGFPCRVSLEDAKTGDELVLVNHQHVPDGGPYAASHAIFVRRDAPHAKPAVGEVPEVLARRMLSARALDHDNMIQAGEVVDGREVAPMIDRFLAMEGIAQVHLHFAGRGCYAATAMPVD